MSGGMVGGVYTNFDAPQNNNSRHWAAIDKGVRGPHLWPRKTPMTIDNIFDLRVFPEPMSGCWIWTSAFNKDGYACYGSKRVSRIIMALKVGRPLLKTEYALHRCDSRFCVNPDHLYIGSAKQNTADMMRRGRGRYVEQSKLTPDQVIEIYGIRPADKITSSAKLIAPNYGVNYKSIMRIWNKSGWKSILGGR